MLVTFRVLSAVMAVMACASMARAETAYPRCERTPTDKEGEAARGLYQAGKVAFDEADYTKALQHFNDSYARDCTKHLLLVVIARAHELRGDKAEAIHALKVYLERVPDARDAETHRRRIANLEAQVAPSAPAPAPRAEPTPAPTAPPAAPMAPAPAVAAGRPWYPLLLVGAGGAAIVTGVVVHAIGLSKVAEAELDCPSHNTCGPPGAGADPNAFARYASVRDLGNEGATLANIVAPVLYGAGGVLVAGGLTWYFLQPEGATTKVGLVPAAGRDQWGLRLRGSF